MEKFNENIFNKIIYLNETRFKFHETLKELSSAIFEITDKGIDYQIQKSDEDKINGLIENLSFNFNENDNPECIVYLSLIQGLRLYYLLKLFNQKDLLIEMFNSLRQEDKEKYQSKLTGIETEMKNYKKLLEETSIKYKYYYPEYREIKLQNGYTQIEKDAVYKLGINRFDTWDFAFCVLAIRHKGNQDFIKLFNDDSYGQIDIHNLNSLLWYSKKFYNAYKCVYR